MEENCNQTEIQTIATEICEPEDTDNLQTESSIKKVKDPDLAEGKSTSNDPPEKLILGKFKSVEDLSKAYKELQKYQGKSSEELGTLRKELAAYTPLKDAMEAVSNRQASIIPVIERDKTLYDKPEYFQNPIFKEMYKEALCAYGENLDTDRMVNLLEEYVGFRIKNYDKQKMAESETQQVLDSMTYSKNPKSSINPPKKSLDEMTEDEFKVSLRKLI